MVWLYAAPLDGSDVNADLTEFFERLISMEAVRVFKPAPETHRYAAGELGVTISDTRLIAAHDWDVTGAIRAGAQAAFVRRKGWCWAKRPRSRI